MEGSNVNKRVSPPAESAGVGQAAQEVRGGVVAPDAFTGLGGSYVRDPETGMRVPTDETLIHHKNQGKVDDGQEDA